MSVLAGLRKGHPRLIALEGDWQRIGKLIESDPTARAVRDKLYEKAVGVLDDPPVEHKLVGPRLLTESRRCVDRVYTLAAVYRLTGEERFAERAGKEMLAAAAFPDWNPSHFLDTAEMTHALAIGYDWLYDYLSDEDRAAIRTAIVEKGLKPALPLYENDSWQVASHHNWNQVCNGGLAIGALAIADEEPALAARVVENAVRLLPNAMASYAPDGGWAEGPGYWNYATYYNAMLLAALETALGGDFGLAKMEGFAATGFFPLHFSGPSGRTFNYADGGDRPRSATQMLYLARKFGQPVFSWYQHRYLDGPKVLDLVWYTAETKSPVEAGLPLDAFYGGINVVFLRSAWEDPDALFVAFKGGDNRANHSHLDLGAFVLDAGGCRWAVDLGSDNYNLPGYWDTGDEGQRFTYFRLSTRAHSTLTFAGGNQRYNAAAPIIGFGSAPERAWAVADLSEAYAQWARSVRRGVAMLDRRRVLIQDEIDAKGGDEIIWSMLTPAEVALDGARAVLSQGKSRLEARIIQGGGLRFEVKPASAPEGQAQQPGVSILHIRIPGGEGKHRLGVLLTPYREGTEPAEKDLPLTPLADWQQVGTQ